MHRDRYLFVCQMITVVIDGVGTLHAPASVEAARRRATPPQEQRVNKSG